jgi:hypothetical protein
MRVRTTAVGSACRPVAGGVTLDTAMVPKKIAMHPLIIYKIALSFSANPGVFVYFYLPVIIGLHWQQQGDY